MALYGQTAWAVASLLATSVVAKFDLDKDHSNEDSLSLLQTRSQYSARPWKTIEEAPSTPDILEYLSMYRPCAACKEEVRIGSGTDGGYPMCGELLSDVTGAYSFGIDGRDEWGADISTQLGVTVHQADCYNLTLPTCPEGRTCNFDFKPVCIGENFDKGSSQKFETLQEQLEARGDVSGDGSLVMKIDIEGSEWTFFADERNKPLLRRFSQIIGEFHGVAEFQRLESSMGTPPAFSLQRQAMKNLLQDFVIVHLHQNNCCKTYKIDEYEIGNLVEITLVRRDLIEAGFCNPDPLQTKFRNMLDREDLPPAHLPGGTQH